MTKAITLISTAMLWLCSIAAMAQPTIYVVPRDADGVVGDTVDVDILVDDFTTLTSMQFTVRWNTSDLRFVDIQNANTDLGLIPPPILLNFNTLNAGSGFNIFSWGATGGGSVTLPGDSVVLFTSRYIIESPTGNVAVVQLSDDPIAREVYDENGEITSSSTFTNGPATEAGYSMPPASSCTGTCPSSPPADDDSVCVGASGFTQSTCDATVATGSQVCLDVRVCNFDEITSMSYTIEFNPTLLQYSNICYTNLGNLSSGSFVIPSVGTGVVTFNWIDSIGAGVTLPDGRAIYSICFDAIGPGGTMDTIEYTGQLTDLEITDANNGGNHIGFTGLGGVVTISGSGAAAVGVEVSEESVVETENECVDVSVTGFTDVTELNYSLNWDETIIDFDRIEDAGVLTGLNFDTSPALVDDGRLSVEWSSGSPTSLADGTVIYSVCYDGIGTAGEMSDIVISDDPVTQAASKSDGMGGTETAPVVTTDGEMRIIGSGTFQFLIPDSTASMGDTVCIPIQFRGFNNVISLQFGVEWDDTVLEFIDSDSIALLGPTDDHNLGQPESNRATFIYQDITFAGKSVPNNTAIYEICFRVIGDPGDVSPINIGQIGGNDPEVVVEPGGIIAYTQSNGSLEVVDNAISLTGTVTNVTCFGDSTGAINISPVGGMPAYTYQWDYDNRVTEDLTGIPAGTYNVTVTDMNGVTVTDAYTVTEGDEIVLTTSVTDVTCVGGSNGAIDLTVTGGASPYTYGWDTGSPNEDLTGLTARTYSVTVTDANSCTATAMATVSESGGISFELDITDVTCDGLSDGAVDITVLGSSGMLNYDFSNNTYDQMTANTMISLNNIPAEVIDLTVTDANGCTGDTTFTIAAGDAVTATFTVTEPRCFGEANGSIDLSPTGGTGDYDFDWNEDSFDGIEDPTNMVMAGSFVVAIRDTNTGCRVTVPITVGQPDELVLTPTITNIQCNGDGNGQINLAVAGGTMPYSYNWSPALSNSPNQSGLSAGNYDVTVTDGNSCTATGSYMITEPSAIMITGTVTNQSMPMVNDGAVDITVTGGIAPYTFSWNSGAFTTEDISGLAPGTYTVEVRDQNGCLATLPFTVNAADAPIVTIDVTSNPSCNGFADGAINITVSGGTPAYTFVWSNMSTDEDINGLVAGTYNVTVTDGNGVTSTLPNPVILTDPPLLTGSATATDVGCGSTDDGSVSLTVNGGTPNYTFLWSNNATTQNLNNVGPNTYTVTITDLRGCTTTASATVGASGGATISTSTITDVVCRGASTGAIDITVTGGTLPYVYAWDNGQPATEDISGLPAGTYTVTVTDDNGNGCPTEETFIVREPVGMSLSLSDVTDVSCNGVADGAIDIEVTGGQAPYDYAWQNALGMPLGVSQDLSALSGGDYSVTITDANGCVFEPNPITVNEPGPININASVSNASAANNDGAINLSISGGSVPYTFNWTTTNGGGLNVAAQNQTGLNPGYYFVTVTDDNGCSNTRDSILVEGVFNVIGTVSQVTCAGANDGSVDLEIIGGFPAFRFDWSDGGAPVQNRTDLGPGIISVTVTDASNTEIIRTFDLGNPDPIVLQTNITNESGTGCNGSINLTVSGGNAPYSYQWSNGATNEDPSDLCKGSYDITVTDAKNCIAILSDVTVAGSVMQISSSDTDDASCNGEDDGCVRLAIIGGCEPYRYTLSAGSRTELKNETNVEFCDLSAGSYTITVEDVNGQEIIFPFDIEEPSPINITVDQVMNNMGMPNSTSCTGSIQISVSGGNGAPYNYVWSNGDTNEDIQGLCDDISPYSVTVTDANGCTGVVSGIDLRRIVVESQDVRCVDDCNGEFRLDVSGADGPYTYTWSDGGTGAIRTGLCAGSYGLTITNGNNEVIAINDNGLTIRTPSEPLSLSVNSSTQPIGTNGDGSIDITVRGGWGNYTYSWTGPDGFTSGVEDLSLLDGGIYEIIVFDDNGCQVSQRIDLSALVLTVNNSDVTKDDESCFNECDGFISLNNIRGGTSPFTYEWDTGEDTPFLDDLCPGTYSVTVTDVNGIPGMFSYEIIEAERLALSFNVSTSVVDAIVEGGTMPYSYQWTTSGQDSTASVVVDAGEYSLLVTDNNGCTVTGTVSVDGNGGLLEGECTDVKNVITPNNDGDNDEFLILCDETVTMELQIFNRWGQLVFESPDYQNNWMGTNASDEDLPEGGYFYVLEYIDPSNGEREQQKGHITIIR